MSTTTQPGLLDLPAPATMNPAQLRGAHCVSCTAELHGDTAVDLEPRQDSIYGVVGRWYPRGCRGCSLRLVLALVRTHSGACEQCADDATLCETRRALALELRR